MIIYSRSPRVDKKKEVANGPIGGQFNIIRYKDDLSQMVANVGMYQIKLTREDYLVIRDIFEKYPVKGVTYTNEPTNN